MEAKLAAYRRMKALEMEKKSILSTREDDLGSSVTEYESNKVSKNTIGSSKEEDVADTSNFEQLFQVGGIRRTLSSLSSNIWQFILKVSIWICLFTFFVKTGFGSVFVVISGFYFVYTSMSSGSRVEGEPSAYSVFNEGFERLDGTFTAEQFENELKGGLLPRT